MSPDRVLVIVALTTEQPSVEERLRSVLALGGPGAEAQVYAKRVDDLVAADLDALAVSMGGWDAVSRLRVGDVASGGFPAPSSESGPGNGPESPDASRPHATDGSPCWCDPDREDHRG